MDDPKDGLPKDELKDSPEGKKPVEDPSLAPMAGSASASEAGARRAEKPARPQETKDSAPPASLPPEAACSSSAGGVEAPLPAGPAGPGHAVDVPAGLTEKPGDDGVRAAFEHPWVVRFCHWLNAVSVFVLVASGLRIFRAFPSFGPKIPQENLVDIPKALTLGGWLGGALQWHFTFMWIFAGTGVLYLAYQFLSGHYKTVLFTPKDIRGVWPMVRHYFFFGPQPPATEQYNPLQKLAYTSTVLFGIASVLTGVVLYKPAQFWWLAWIMGGFPLARVWHFAAMCGFLAFIPGHLIMVVLHGWNNFASMLTGWKRDPGYRLPLS